MDIIDVEKKCQKIIELRTKRLAIQQEINKYVAEVLAFMHERDKRTLKIGKYTVEISKRTKRKFDFDFLDKLQAQGILPQSAMSKEDYDRLLIVSSANIQLVGNKFMIK